MNKLLLIVFLAFGLQLKATTTGTLNIQGTVLPVNEITVVPNNDTTSLNIVSGEVNKLVATVTETSNNLNGYTISMRSAKGSKLVHSIDSSKSTNYTVSYDGATAVSLTTSDQAVKVVSSLAGLTTNSSEVKVNVLAYSTAPAGVYSDTITVTISGN